MIINNHDQSRFWVLRLMKDGKVRKRQEIYQDVIDLAKISDDEVNQKMISGQSRVLNLLGWAISSFVKAGILNRLDRSTYQITDIGLKMAEQWKDRTEISQKDFVGLVDWENYQKNKENFLGDSVAETDDEIDFETQAQSAIKKIEAQIAAELLTKLQQGTPLFFEKAVLKLLLAMGYGGKENLFEHTGKSHDGGIDGVIKQDPLGIHKIHIQAKRYTGSVGDSEVRDFAGALQVQGANKGVFIATSSFTASAKASAKKLSDKIVLIDSDELVALMIKYKVGIQTKEVLEICEIDEDFFE